MFHMTLIVEDLTIIATETNRDESDSKGIKWDVLLIDGVTGTKHRCVWTFEQLTAIFALGVGSVGEDNASGYHAEKLQSIAESALECCPKECWPIP